MSCTERLRLSTATQASPIGNSTHATARSTATTGRTRSDRRLTTRKAPIVFAPELARGFFGHLTAAIRGTAQYRSKAGYFGPGGSLFRFKESAGFLRRIAHQPRGGNVARVLAAPHQAGDLIGFLQAVHSEAEPVLRAVLAGAEVAVAADSQPA